MDMLLPMVRGGIGICWAALVGVVAGGCAEGGSLGEVGARWSIARDADPSGAVDEKAAWPFWPRRLRIHPLTQFVTDRDSGQLLIETRLEFLDRDGNTGRAWGQVLIDLHAAHESADPITTWARDLATLEANREHYDDLTRTYLFRLEFDPGVLPEEPELRAYHRSADGRVIQAPAYQLRR